MIKECLVCGKEFKTKLSCIKRNRGKYCSIICSNKAHIKGKVKKCLVCNKEFWALICYEKRGGNKFCSYQCYNLTRKGKHRSEETKKRISEGKKGCKHPNWKGGRGFQSGYILILQPNHPFASKRGYIMEHRLVMEKYIGRYLKPEERVHHINEIRNDNRIENLFLCKNIGEHRRLHKKLSPCI